MNHCPKRRKKCIPKQIDLFKCVSFIKYMNYYKKKNMCYRDYQKFLYIMHKMYQPIPDLKPLSLYEQWQQEHEIQKLVVEEQKKVFIDFSVNKVSDLIEIAEKNPFIYGTQYNIDLKILHEIKPELCLLNEMVGMKELKKNILDQLLYYLQGFHKGSDDYKHTVITGPPGTGKTEIAKVLGNIYSKMNVIQKPQDVLKAPFKKATRSDMIAGYLGQTAIKTKSLVAQTLGGVLFLDEAYSFGDDSFSKECIDTLCELLSDQKDSLMVIIAGYETELNERFFSLNAGLESRFVWRFKIDNYNANELWEIFIKKVENCGWKIGKIDGEKWFQKNYDSFSGFGRDVECLLFKVKIAHSRRVYGKPDCEKKIIEIADLESGYTMFMKSKENTKEYILKKSQKALSSMFL